MSDKMLDMHNWVLRKTKDKIESNICEFSKAFGFVNMSNGKKAQIIVTLQIDENDWL